MHALHDPTPSFTILSVHGSQVSLNTPSPAGHPHTRAVGCFIRPLGQRTQLLLSADGTISFMHAWQPLLTMVISPGGHGTHSVLSSLGVSPCNMHNVQRLWSSFGTDATSHGPHAVLPSSSTRKISLAGHAVHAVLSSFGDTPPVHAVQLPPLVLTVLPEHARHPVPSSFDSKPSGHNSHCVLLKFGTSSPGQSTQLPLMNA